MSVNQKFKRSNSIRRNSLPPLTQKPPEHRRRRSLTSGLQNIFHRKQFYSLTNIHTDSVVELYSSDAHGGEGAPVYSAIPNDSPRIWRVRHRNSLSESVVENLVLETVQEHPQSTKSSEKQVVIEQPFEPRDEHEYNTCTDRYDVMGLFQDFSMYEFVGIGSNLEGRNLILKRSNDLSECPDYQNHEYGRYRRHSVSSTRQSFSTNSPASSHASSILSLRENSFTGDEGVDTNTSYWNLRIPDDDFIYTAENRRNSWSPGISTFPKSSFTAKTFSSRWVTPKLHINGQFEKLCSCQRCLEKASNTNSAAGSVRNSTQRRERKRSRSETQPGIMKDQLKLIHRSRSANCREKPRNLRRPRRANSVVPRTQFSDIEASDASDVEPNRSGISSVTISGRSSQNSSSIELCTSSSEDKDSGYQKTDENEKLDTNEDQTLSNVNSPDVLESHGEKFERNKDEISYVNLLDVLKSHDGNMVESVEERRSHMIRQDGVTNNIQSTTDIDHHEAISPEPKANQYKFIDNIEGTTVHKGVCGFESNEMEFESVLDSLNTEHHINEVDAEVDGSDREQVVASFTLPKENNNVACTSSTMGTGNHSLTKSGNRLLETNLEFKSMSMDDLLFCSGRRNSSSGDPDDVKDVFEAINTEALKQENKDKDMLVMFLVGGELKVLRRPGATGHGDRIRSEMISKVVCCITQMPQTPQTVSPYEKGLIADLPSMTRQDFSQSNGNNDHVIYSSQPTPDYKRPRPKSEIIIGRSQSFAGMAEPSPQKKQAPGAMVLGESFRHHRGATMPAPQVAPVAKRAVGVSFRKSPKVPRPNRALLMFQSVKKGIREFIDATKEDIEDLQSRDLDGTSTAQGRLHETDKQLKSAERYLKRLEFHLSKLDELQEYYLVQQQLREGVRTMHKAYVTSPGKQRNTLSNVKYGYKECTQTMCNIEAQLEAMMGTFNCKLKGIAGFARLCPGDVFEVTTRHGSQKWKTKGRIEKSGNQKWDTPEFNFKAVVGDIINIKGVEVRAFKSILLGQKSCETKDLFSANPQLMTVSINVNGSLKLSIVITWNPLDGVDESVVFMETPMRPQGTPRRRPVSVIAINGQHHSGDQSQFDYDRRHSNPASMRDDNFILRSNASTPHSHNISSYHGLDSPRVGATRPSDHLPEAYHYSQLGPLYSQSVGHIPGGFSSSPASLLRGSDSQLPHSANQSSVFSSSLPVISHLHFPSVSLKGLNGSRDNDSAVSNVEDVVHNLSSALEDYHGQYTELDKLEELVKLANKLLRKQFRNSSRSSSISVSIEDALEAFDFLDTEESIEGPQSPAINNTKNTFDDMLCSPESTAKTADSGIESLAQRLSEDTQLGSSLGSSPVPPSLGNDEVDQCLMYHLTYCERLLENLGAFGPLKCREIYALDKLQKQSTIIESLLKQAKSGSQVDLHSVMSTLCDNKSLREFWVKCTDQNSLYVSPDRLLLCLEQKFAPVISERFMMDPSKVCQHVITRILDIPDYEAEQGRPYFVITLHQFMLYFNDEGGLKNVEDVTDELKLVEKLMSGNSDMVIKAILTLRDSIPSAPCLKVIGMLLVTLDKEVEQCTISYLSLIQKKKENRDRAMIVFVEGLEDRTSEIRAGACAALAILEASESKDQLVYLWQSDSSQLVQAKAKEALMSMGEEGRKSFEEARLNRHGFQGLQVQKGTFM